MFLLWAVHDGGYDNDTWYWGALLALAMLVATVVARRGTIRLARGGAPRADPVRALRRLVVSVDHLGIGQGRRASGLQPGAALPVALQPDADPALEPAQCSARARDLDPGDRGAGRRAAHPARRPGRRRRAALRRPPCGADRVQQCDRGVVLHGRAVRDRLRGASGSARPSPRTRPRAGLCRSPAGADRREPWLAVHRFPIVLIVVVCIDPRPSALTGLRRAARTGRGGHPAPAAGRLQRVRGADRSGGRACRAGRPGRLLRRVRRRDGAGLGGLAAP